MFVYIIREFWLPGQKFDVGEIAEVDEDAYDPEFMSRHHGPREPYPERTTPTQRLNTNYFEKGKEDIHMYLAEKGIDYGLHKTIYEGIIPMARLRFTCSVKMHVGVIEKGLKELCRKWHCEFANVTIKDRRNECEFDSMLVLRPDTIPIKRFHAVVGPVRKVKF